MKSGRSQRGFTITEILATLGLLVIFFDAAGQVYRSTILLGAAGAQFSGQSARTDSAVRQLRRDVWNARQIAAADSHTLNLNSADGTQITWRFGSDGTSRTISGSAPEHWPSTCENCTVTVAGPYLDVSDGSSVMRFSGPMLRSHP